MIHDGLRGEATLAFEGRDVALKLSESRLLSESGHGPDSRPARRGSSAVGGAVTGDVTGEAEDAVSEGE